MFKKLALTFSLLAVSSFAHAIVIDFDELASGTVVNTHYSDVTFGTTYGSGDVIVYNGCCSDTDPNSIYPGNFNADMSVSFTSAVNNLSFYSGGDNDVGAVAQIDVFGIGNILLGTVDLIADGDGIGSTEELQDLSAFSNIIGINIYNVTDAAGLVYDTFSFDIASVPEPSIVWLLGSGLLLVGFARRKA